MSILTDVCCFLHDCLAEPYPDLLRYGSGNIKTTVGEEAAIMAGVIAFAVGSQSLRFDHVT